MNKIFKYLTLENIVTILSIIFFIFIHFKIFTNQLLTSGDSWYLPEGFISNYIPSFWYDQFSTGGLYPLTFTQIPIFIAYRILHEIFGINYEIGSKLVFYFPYLIFTIISGFIIPFKITKDKLISSLIFLIFSTNTFILSVVIGSSPLIALSYSLMPITLYFINNFILFNKYKRYQYLLSGIFFGLIIMLDIRYAHIFSLFLLIYLLLNYFNLNLKLKIKETTIYISLFMSGVLIINLFWILPYVFSGNDFISLPENYDNPNWINIHTVNNYTNLFALKHSYWPNILDGIRNSTGWYWFIFPFLILLQLIINKKKNKYNYTPILFLISAILFLGSNFIFKDFNTFLFSNVPTFQIQRDPFKYFVLIILSLYVALSSIKFEGKYLKIITIFSFVTPIIISINFNYGLFKEKIIPEDFIKLNNIILSDNSINRSLWIPYKHRYGEFTNLKSSMQYIDFQSYGFLNLSNSKDDIIYNEEKFKELINKFGIKYIVIPYDPMSEWDQSAYSAILNNNQHLKTLLSFKDLEYIQLSKDLHLFVNKNYSSMIVSNDISYKKINSTKYKVKINNLKSYEDLSLLQSFHKQWNLYLNPIKPNSKDCNVIQEYNNEGKNIKECEHTQKFFEGEELSYLWKQPVFEDSHKLVYDYANQWTIDPEYIKANFDKSMYKENPDGSIDVELTLYFKPQSYFYLGIIISGTTLILCLGYLGYVFYRKRGV